MRDIVQLMRCWQTIRYHMRSTVTGLVMHVCANPYGFERNTTCVYLGTDPHATEWEPIVTTEQFMDHHTGFVIMTNARVCVCVCVCACVCHAWAQYVVDGW
eukprot:GHVR01004407.1.p1 GENE.GHVR01004407.1~~GHVR01004407.1.p1  ORF type:complete len:101 (-),score=23.58 GHVR01004407.1:258-560(-)